MECLGVGFGLMGDNILDLSWGFVAVVVEMEVDDLEFEVAVVRVIWGCLNWRMHFLWRLSRMPLEGRMSNVGGRLFGMVMWADFLMEFYFYDGGYFRKVASSKMGVAMVEMF